MNHLKPNKALQALKPKRPAGKTTTGTEVGWMVDCKRSIELCSSSALSNPAFFFPPLVLGDTMLARTKDFLTGENEWIMKQNNQLSFAWEPMKSKQELKRKLWIKSA